MRRIALLGFVVLATFFGHAVHAADNQIWGALLLATNEKPATDTPAELLSYQKRLSKVFGYTSFKVLGKSTKGFSDDTEQWLIPGKTFSVRSVVTPTDDQRFVVDLQLYQDKKELVQTVAKLGPECPIFIRGPLYGDGQLIIAIMVRD